MLHRETLSHKQTNKQVKVADEESVHAFWWTKTPSLVLSYWYLPIIYQMIRPRTRGGICLTNHTALLEEKKQNTVHFNDLYINEKLWKNREVRNHWNWPLVKGKDKTIAVCINLISWILGYLQTPIIYPSPHVECVRWCIVISSYNGKQRFGWFSIQDQEWVARQSACYHCLASESLFDAFICK